MRLKIKKTKAAKHPIRYDMIHLPEQFNVDIKNRFAELIIILVLPPGVVCQSNCVLPMPGTADGDVVSRCQVLGRAGSVHHGADHYLLHGLPDATVTGFWSLENPHFNMFTIDRPTGVRNRLSAFQVVQGFSAPAGRCSSALMFRCTLVSRGSSRSLHSSTRAAFAVVLMGLVHVITLIRDSRRGTTPRCPLGGCLSSVACRVRSVRLATALLKPLCRTDTYC